MNGGGRTVGWAVQRWVGATVLLSMALGNAALGAVLPFYQQQRADGLEAWRQGELDVAARRLRVAAFGMLDEPAELMATLVPLALIEKNLGRGSEIVRTMDQILEVERRFSVFRDASLDDSVRQSFEALLFSYHSPAELLDCGSFAPLAQEKILADLEKLPPQARRQRLQELVATSGSAVWQAHLAATQLELEDWEAAITSASAVLEQEPGSVSMLCLRGLARARASRCTAALEDLARCPRTTSSVAEAVGRLGCLVSLGRLGDAAAFAATLTPDVSGEREVRRLTKGLPSSSEADAEKSASLSPSVAVAPEVAAAQVRATELLTAARSATTGEQLESIIREALALAAKHPMNRSVLHAVAEIAYRGSRWQEVAKLLAGPIGTPVDRYDLWFYLAVARYETRDYQGARDALEKALPGLQRTDFVEGYIERIQSR